MFTDKAKGEVDCSEGDGEKALQEAEDGGDHHRGGH